MTIDTSNDGKGKRQSWTASAEINGSRDNQQWCVTLTAYGPTEMESINNLYLAVRNALKDAKQNFAIKY